MFIILVLKSEVLRHEEIHTLIVRSLFCEKCEKFDVVGRRRSRDWDLSVEVLVNISDFGRESGIRYHFRDKVFLIANITHIQNWTWKS